MYSFSQYQSLLECLLQKWNVSLINSFKLYGFLYMIHTDLLLAEYIPNKQQQQQENPMKSMGNNG